MKRIPKAIYQSADEIEQRIRQRESDSMRVRPDTQEHRKIMKEISQLRIYAETKRWLSGPTRLHA